MNLYPGTVCNCVILYYVQILSLLSNGIFGQKQNVEAVIYIMVVFIKPNKKETGSPLQMCAKC